MTEKRKRFRCRARGCRKMASAFGQFLGGICDLHAITWINSGDMKLTDFHPEHRERLQKLLD